MEFKWRHFQKELILWGLRWYVAYPISYRQLEEMMGERGVTVDHSTLNRWALKVLPHSQYLNNFVEKDHRAVKRIVRPMLGFKSFWAARYTIAGIEVMHAIRKGELAVIDAHQTPADEFY